MSVTIDEKVVEMRFDNKQFESNVQTSLSTIDKLKQSLNLTGATKGLENVSAAAQKCNLSPLSSAVETVRMRFSALEVMAVTALANITNSAVNTGKQLLSALTIDPIKTGFQEYETQINAVQTILANTQHEGTNLQQVNAALDELNTYADKTIYNFTEMTRNIGTFTAAGVDLQTSVDAIKGIANLAAVSGSTSQQASTAMYQLSQALAAGKVQLMDWNSVVNAGMGGKVFQDALIRTSELLGTGAKQAVETYGSFRESLTRGGWLTTEVLTETLKQFAGAYTEADLIQQGFSESQAKEIAQMAQTAEDAATKVKTFTQLWDTLKEAAQSGWTQTWELIIGDFEGAKAFLTDLSDLFGGIINESAEARNSMLEGAMTSNWDKLVKQINEAGVATEDFNTELAKTVEAHGHSVEQLTEEYGSLGEAFRNGAVDSDLVVKTLKNMAGVSSDVSGSTENMTEKLEYFQDVVDRVWNGDFKNGEERIKALTEAGYDYAQVQELVNKTVDGHRLTLEDLSDAQLESIGYTEEQISAIHELAIQAEQTGTPINELISNLEKPSGRELLIESVMNAIQGLIKSLGAVKDAWRDIFPPMTSDQLYNAIERINELSKHLVISDERADQLRRTFRGLFAILDIITSLIGGAFKTAVKVVSRILGLADVDILSLTASVGDAIVKFRDWLFENNALAKGIKAVADGAKAGVKMVRDWIKAFLEIPEVSAALNRLKNAVSDTFSNIGEYFSGGMERIREFIDRVKSMDSISLDDIGKIFKDFKDNVIDYFLDIDGIFDTVSDALSDFRDIVETKLKEAGVNFEELKDTIVGFAESVYKAIKDNFGAIVAIGIGVTLAAFAKKIYDALKPIGEVVDSFIGILDGVSSVLKSYSKSLKADALKDIAISIAILVGSLVLLSKLDQEKLWSAAGLMGVLAAGLVIISKLSSSMGGIKDAAKSSVSLPSIASSILILAIALKQMDGLNEDNILRNLGILASIAGGLSAVAIVLGKKAPTLSKGSFFLLSFAGSMKLIIGALADLETLNVDNLEGKMTILAGAIGGLVIAVKACKGVKAGSALTVVAVVVALKLLIGSFEDIANMDTAKIESNLDAFIAIFGTFAGLMISTKFAGKYAAKAGSAVLMMSVALILVIQAVKMVADVPPTDLERASDVISQLILVFAAVIAASKFAGENAAKAGVMLALMSVAILILSGVMALLSSLDPSGLQRALDAITQLELVFGALIAVSKLASKEKGTIITLGVIVGVLSIALAGLSTIEPDNITAASEALSLLVGVFSIAVAATSLAKKANSSLAAMTIVVVALGAVLGLLASLPIGSTMEVSESLSLLLLSLSASMVIISNTKTVSPTAYTALIILSGIMAILATILGVLASFNVGPTLEIAESLSLLLLSLSGACTILSVVGMTGSAAFVGIGALSALIGAVGAIMAAVGALVTYIPDAKDWLENGMWVLEQIGTGLGSFFGNMVGGFLEGVTSGLPGIGTNLATFMDNAKPFFDGIQNVNVTALDGIKNLASAVLILTAQDVLDGLTSWFTGGNSLVKFGEELVAFAPKFAEFAKEMEDVDSGVLNAASNAALTVATFASKVPNQGGAIANLIGDNTLSTFGAELETFGPKFAAYSQQMKGVNTSVVTASSSAAEAVAAFASKVPNQGGLLSNLIGDNTLSTFGTELEAFGPKFAAYSNAVSSVKNADVTASSAAAETVAAFASKIPNQGGLLSNLIGDNTLSAFGAELEVFGPAFAKYSMAMLLVNPDVVTKTSAAAATLVEFSKGIDNYGGVVDFFTGGNDLETFGTQLVSFGESLASYSQKMEGVKPEAITSTTAAADALVKLDAALTDKTGLFNGETTLSDFGFHLEWFGAYLSSYYWKVNPIDTGHMSDITNEIQHLIDVATGMSGVDTGAMGNFGSALEQLGNSGVDGFVSAFENSTGRVSEAASAMLNALVSSVNSGQPTVVGSFNTLLTQVLTTIGSKNATFETYGQNLMVFFGFGITTKGNSVVQSMTQIITNIIGRITAKYAEFESAGRTAMDEFNAGFNAGSNNVINTCLSAVNSAISAIRSKRGDFRDAGVYVTDGLVDGISDNIDRVRN